jgi:hypothetical protein
MAAGGARGGRRSRALVRLHVSGRKMKMHKRREDVNYIFSILPSILYTRFVSLMEELFTV